MTNPDIAGMHSTALTTTSNNNNNNNNSISTKSLSSRRRCSRIHYILCVFLICMLKLSTDFTNLHKDDFVVTEHSNKQRSTTTTATMTETSSSLSQQQQQQQFDQRLSSLSTVLSLSTFNKNNNNKELLQSLQQPQQSLLSTSFHHNNNNNITITSNSTSSSSSSTVRFIFVIGIEGTGHHLMGSIVNESPHAKYLESIGVFPGMHKELASSLMDNKHFQSLWTAHCNGGSINGASPPINNGNANSILSGGSRTARTTTTTTGTNFLGPKQQQQQQGQQQGQRRRRLRAKKLFPTSYNIGSDSTTTTLGTAITPHGPNVQQFLDITAQRLKRINDFVTSKQESPNTSYDHFINSHSMTQTTMNDKGSNTNNNNNSNNNKSINMLLNTWKEYSNVGEISFPNGRHSCRKLNYPNLDLLYQACAIAQVDCGHVYIYRNPYSVIRSTTKRKMHNTVLEAIHLYTSYYYLIYGQLVSTTTSTTATASSSGRRTLGCWELMKEEKNDDSTTHMALSSLSSSTTTMMIDDEEEMWKPIQQLFGWTDYENDHDHDNNNNNNNNNDKDFYDTLKTIYKAPKTMTQEERLDLVPPKLYPYMESMVKAHQSVIDLCRAQVALTK